MTDPAPGAPVERRRNGRLALLVQLTGVALCVPALWWVARGVDLGLLRQTLGRVTLGALLLVVALNLAGQLLRAAGWWVLLGPRHRLPAARLVRYEFAAQAATALTPEGSGEALRLWWLARDGVPVATTTAVIGARKLISSLGLVPFALALPWLVDLPAWCGWLIAIYSGLLLALLAWLLTALHRRRPTTPSAGRFRRLTGRMLEGLQPLRAPSVLAASLALACATRATDVAAAWILCSSLDLPSGLATGALALLLVEVSNVLPTAPAQIGSFDAAAASALRALGGSGTAGLAFAVLLHAQQLLPQIVAGLVPLLTASSVRRREASEEGSRLDEHRVG